MLKEAGTSFRFSGKYRSHHRGTGKEKHNILPLNEITQDVLIEQFYDMGEYLNVDTRQGSIYWDASMGSIIRTSTFLEQLKMVKEIISIFTCTGDVLDEKMMERGLTRNPANPTPATYYVSFVGMVPEMDSKMSVDDYFFYLIQ